MIIIGVVVCVSLMASVSVEIIVVDRDGVELTVGLVTYAVMPTNKKHVLITENRNKSLRSPNSNYILLLEQLHPFINYYSRQYRH